MTPPPVLVTRTIPGGAMALLSARCAVTANRRDRPMRREELLAEAAGKRGLLTMLTDRVDDELLDAAGASLGVVSNYAVGLDNVDVAACTRRGVLVTNTPDVLTEATADLTWALILAASRRVAEGDRVVRAGRPWAWAPTFMLGREVNGGTLGVVGFGRIGRAVAARAPGFGMDVLHTSRSGTSEPGAVDLPELLARADVVTVHLPLTEETRRRFGREEFRAMKRTAVFVNTSRGPLVDEAALADALRTGEIFAAGLDVYEREPEVHPALLALENVVLAPHLGSATVETREAMARLAAENLVAALEGREPPSPVNADVLQGASR